MKFLKIVFLITTAFIFFLFEKNMASISKVDYLNNRLNCNKQLVKIADATHGISIIVSLYCIYQLYINNSCLAEDDLGYTHLWSCSVFTQVCSYLYLVYLKNQNIKIEHELLGLNCTERIDDAVLVNTDINTYNA